MDREKVIKETKDGIAFAESRGFGGLANTMRDALALLKEQPQIVRCKYCIYKEEHPSPYWKYWCNRLKCGCDDDWFCADGEWK